MGRPYMYTLGPDGEPQPCEDIFAWARWMEGRGEDGARLALDEVAGVTVSTVFLGIDHSFWEGPPLLFESMVFGGPHDQIPVRYSSRAEALRGHAAIVQELSARPELRRN